MKNLKKESVMKEEKMFVIKNEVWKYFAPSENLNIYSWGIESVHLSKESVENRFKQLEMDAKKIVADDYNFDEDDSKFMISPNDVDIEVGFDEIENSRCIYAKYKSITGSELIHQFTIEEFPISHC